MYHYLFDSQIWVSLLILTFLEIVLGIDNLIFIFVLTNRLPITKQRFTRQFGLMLACITRLLLLAIITEITKLTQPLFTLYERGFSWRDLILIAGGVFLIAKGTSEIHYDVATLHHLKQQNTRQNISVIGVLVQIMLLDIIFSLDSVITAVGLAQEYLVMALAICIAIILMIVASEPLARFIRLYPSLKMLALSFLLLVGMTLIADGLSFHIPRGYLYFAIAFSFFVEMLNILAGKRRVPK